MRYTQEDVSKLVASVEKAFTSHMAKQADISLAKSEDVEKEHEDKHEDKKPEHEEKLKHEAKEEHHEDGKKHDEKGEKPESHEGHDYDEEDMAHMEKMYRSMSKGELEAHHGCIMKCMGKSESKPSEMEKAEKEMGADGHKNGGEMSASEPKITPGSKSPASKAGEVQMEKSENTEVKLLKSELAVERAEKEAIKNFLTALVKKTAPQAKAITSFDVVAKSEMPKEEKSLSKSQIHEILKSKTADPSLKKSDRDAINAFYLTDQVNVNSISHLLK